MPPRSRRDLARVLLNRADGDIALVRTVFEDEGILDTIVGFHAQQAVEKSRKPVLAVSEISYERTTRSTT